MKFTSSVALALAALPFFSAFVAAAPESCQPACCNVVVQTANPSGLTGIDCISGNSDCSLFGKISTCCGGINEISHVGYFCQ
ncbi:hypothetical protein JR316_0012959 [Psilocybe cubensis]|uniref:Uncharacterized protein n=2 Tax=Psilocybe cubensis TaxID=181762 RepID=A0ACB8GHG0_PSICU|nr:hypothetical protein JR316_0012959 [Psilocybe cubensis]KAH9474499.1 hypothetical protein JR316_0012959 [Psilocybe cubensis]